MSFHLLRFVCFSFHIVHVVFLFVKIVGFGIFIALSSSSSSGLRLFPIPAAVQCAGWHPEGNVANFVSITAWVVYGSTYSRQFLVGLFLNFFFFYSCSTSCTLNDKLLLLGIADAESKPAPSPLLKIHNYYQNSTSPLFSFESLGLVRISLCVPKSAFLNQPFLIHEACSFKSSWNIAVCHGQCIRVSSLMWWILSCPETNRAVNLGIKYK